MRQKENAKWNLKLFIDNKGKQKFSQKAECMIWTKQLIVKKMHLSPGESP